MTATSSTAFSSTLLKCGECGNHFSGPVYYGTIPGGVICGDCKKRHDMGKRDPDHDVLNAAAEVLGLFGSGQPSIKVHTDTRHHVKTCNVPEESAEKVNRLRDLLAQRGRFPKLP